MSLSVLMMLGTTTLADGDPTPWSALLYLAGVVVVIGIAVKSVVTFRRWMQADHRSWAGGGLTLGQARRIRDQGLVTEEEYLQLKRAILESMNGNAGDASVKSPDNLFQQARHS